MWRLWKTQKFRKNPFPAGFSAVFGTTRIGKLIPKPSEIVGKPVGFLPQSPLLRHGLSHLARISVRRSPQRKTIPDEPVENSISPASPKSFPRFPRSFPQPRFFRFSTRFRRTFCPFRAVSTSFSQIPRPFPTPFPHPVESLWKTHRICWKTPSVAENFPQTAFSPPFGRDSCTLQGIIPPKPPKLPCTATAVQKRRKIFPTNPAVAMQGSSGRVREVWRVGSPFQGDSLRLQGLPNTPQSPSSCRSAPRESRSQPASDCPHF